MDVDKLVEGVKSILALIFVNMFGVLQFFFTNEYWLMIIAITLDSAALGYSQVESRTKKLLDAMLQNMVKTNVPVGTVQKEVKKIV